MGSRRVRSVLIRMVLVAFALLVGGAGAGLAAEPVRIGVLFDLSGPTAGAGRSSRLGVMMAADRFNKAGGIKGRPLELVIGDTVGDTVKATLLAGKLIDQDKVAAIIGQDGAGLAVRPLVEAAGLPTFLLPDGTLEPADNGVTAVEEHLDPALKLAQVSELPETDPQTPVIREFVRLYREVYQFDRQFPVNCHAGYAWDAVDIVARAMARAGVEAKLLREAIGQTGEQVGVCGIYNLAAGDRSVPGADSPVVVEVRGGQFVIAE